MWNDVECVPWSVSIMFRFPFGKCLWKSCRCCRNVVKRCEACCSVRKDLVVGTWNWKKSPAADISETSCPATLITGASLLSTWIILNLDSLSTWCCLLSRACAEEPIWSPSGHEQARRWREERWEMVGATWNIPIYHLPPSYPHPTPIPYHHSKYSNRIRYCRRQREVWAVDTCPWCSSAMCCQMTLAWTWLEARELGKRQSQACAQISRVVLGLSFTKGIESRI